MNFNEIKSFAKINLALNVTGKTSKLHKIESLVAFIDLHDLILIKKINSKNHQIIFSGKFSKNISLINTVSRLLGILDEKKLIRHKFLVKIKKNIPQKAGLGGGSMNAASILKFLIEKKIVKISIKKIKNIARDIGSDVILGMSNTNTILTSKNEIRTFKNCRKLFTLIVKPNFGCSTKYIYSKVRKLDETKFSNPKKKCLILNL